MVVLSVSAQNGLTMSSTGVSSLLFRGNTLGVNVTDANIEFGVNNLARTIAQKHMPFFGLGARAGNASGKGNVFSAGDFVPGATAEGYVGFTLSNAQAPWVSITRVQIPTREAAKDYYATMKAAAQATITDAALIGFRDSVVMAIDPTVPAVNVPDAIKKLVKEPNKDKKLKHYEELVGVHQPLYGVLVKREAELTRAVIYSEATYKKSGPYRQVWFFAFGGIDGNQFKLVTNYDTTNVANSFSKQNYRGGYVGFGVNAQCGHWTAGLTGQYRQTNNLQDLTKVEYVIRTTRTTGNTSLIQEEKGTAYSGTYGLVEVNQVNFDLAYSLRLDSLTRSYVLISPYGRFNIGSRNTDLLKNTWNLGLGTYFVEKKGKFIGGLYVELPDVGNAIEKAKPEAEQNLLPPEQRITFGIIAKVQLGSILDLF